MHPGKLKFLFLVLVLAVPTGFFLYSTPAPGQNILADFLLTPGRIVFDGRTRSTIVSINNPGDKTHTYRIDFVDMDMDRTGNFHSASRDDGEIFAQDMIRYSPRQVTLKPGDGQVIRLLLRKPPNLPEGEYRSHMRFMIVHTEEEEEAPPVEAIQGLGVQLRPMYGITIPVLVRHGNLDFKVTLSDLEFLPEDDNQNPRVRVLMTRDGNMSSYGNLVVEYFSTSGQNPEVVGQVTRIPVYVPNRERLVEIPLNPPSETVLSEGRLVVTYRALEEEGGGKLASVSARIP